MVLSSILLKYVAPHHHGVPTDCNNNDSADKTRYAYQHLDDSASRFSSGCSRRTSTRVDSDSVAPAKRPLLSFCRIRKRKQQRDDVYDMLVGDSASKQQQQQQHSKSGITAVVA